MFESSGSKSLSICWRRFLERGLIILWFEQRENYAPVKKVTMVIIKT